MAFLDFIKRGKQPEAPAQPAKEAASPTIADLPNDVKGKSMDAGKPTRDLANGAKENPKPDNAAPTGEAGGKEALMHNQSSAEKTQTAMSPTDGHKGHSHSHAKSKGWER